MILLVLVLTFFAYYIVGVLIVVECSVRLNIPMPERGERTMVIMMWPVILTLIVLEKYKGSQ